MGTLFFILSKLIWYTIAPDSLMLILGLTAAVAYHLKYLLVAKVAALILLTMLLVISLLPLGEWLSYPLENRYPVNPTLSTVDGIIVLGGAEASARSAAWQQMQLRKHAERITSFVTLSRTFPEAALVHAGGNGKLTEQKLQETDVVKDFYADMGILTERLRLESNSRNTHENILNTLATAPQMRSQNWVLITSAQHMPRALGICKKQGFNPTPYPVDHQTQKGNLLRLEYDFAGNLSTLKSALREWLGIAVYRLTGKMA